LRIGHSQFRHADSDAQEIVGVNRIKAVRHR
jgi:hypothetical protein